MSTQKATPRPWKIYGNAKNGNICDMAGDDIVASTYAKRSPDVIAANAELIVRAVNCHDELVKIAEAYRNLLKVSARTDGEVATFHHIEDVLKRAGNA